LSSEPSRNLATLKALPPWLGCTCGHPPPCSRRSQGRHCDHEAGPAFLAPAHRSWETAVYSRQIGADVLNG